MQPKQKLKKGSQKAGRRYLSYFYSFIRVHDI